MAEDCFTGVTWPKLLGYGKDDTEVFAVDRRESDGMLAMGMVTDEENFVWNAGDSYDTIAWLAMDPDTETYKWFKIVQDSKRDVYNQKVAVIIFSPDGSKVLISQWTGSRVFVYLDAETGASLGGVSNPLCCPRVKFKDSIAMTNNGDKIIYL